MGNSNGLDGQVTVTEQEGVAILCLDRPEKLNAITGRMLDALLTALREISDEPTVAGIVITGAGGSFSAGGDLNEVLTAMGDPRSSDALREGFNDVTRAMLGAPVPVALAIDGVIAAGAAEIGLCADCRIGSPTAEFFFPDNGLGLTVSNATSYLLPRIVGSKALGIVLGSERLNAARAHQLGLLDLIEDDPVQAAVELLRRWGESTTATMAHLKLLRPALDAVEAAMAREREIGVIHQNSKAGIERFLARSR